MAQAGEKSKADFDCGFEVFNSYLKYKFLKDKDIANNKMHRWLAFLDSNISDKTLKEVMAMDTAISEAQRKIEYISYNEEDYRQIIMREQALMDYHSDMNAYKKEGRQEEKNDMISAMYRSGMTDEAIEKVLKARENN